MTKDIEERIEDLKSIIPKIDGHTKKDRILNRLYGLGHIGLGSFFTYQMPYLSPLSVPLIIDGVGDLITGKHHYIVYRLFKAHPDYEINKLKERQSVDSF